MNVTVDHKQAETILKAAIEEVTNGNWQPSSPNTDDIRAVILGTHLTYRYILTNGLLAKATNGDCNPLVLQAGSELDGAFDARSLCHFVLVPIERDLLGERLGGSNEPFLNKPARFTELSTNNAVRRGNDTRLLHAAMNALSNTKTQEQGLIALKDCLFWIFKRPSRNLADFLNNEDGKFWQSSLHLFSQRLIEQSFEGETCALIAGVTFNLLARIANKEYIVKVHKVNQAGSSSKEVSDIDVYEENVLVYTAEVKDKVFTKEDVSHAVSKAAQAGHHSLIFLKGPRASLRDGSENDLQQSWIEKGFDLYFIGVTDFFNSVLSITNGIEKEIFVSWINDHANSAKIKDDTFKHLAECIKSIE